MLVVTICLWVGIVLGSHILWGWVPILDSANLVFHEAGHVIFGLFSPSLSIYGGTLMQLLIPGLCAFVLYGQGKYGGSYFCLVWFAENLLNVARYMADARAQQLPLIGGMDPRDAHDWTHILNNWGLLSHDIFLANVTRSFALLIMAWAIWLALRRSRMCS